MSLTMKKHRNCLSVWVNEASCVKHSGSSQREKLYIRTIYKNRLDNELAELLFYIFNFTLLPHSVK